MSAGRGQVEHAESCRPHSDARPSRSLGLIRVQLCFGRCGLLTKVFHWRNQAKRRHDVFRLVICALWPIVLGGCHLVLISFRLVVGSSSNRLQIRHKGRQAGTTSDNENVSSTNFELLLDNCVCCEYL